MHCLKIVIKVGTRLQVDSRLLCPLGLHELQLVRIESVLGKVLHCFFFNFPSNDQVTHFKAFPQLLAPCALPVSGLCTFVDFEDLFDDDDIQ